MKKIALATVLVSLSVASAFAADLPARSPYTKAPMLSPASNWSGFYTGVNIGYGWGNDNTDFVAVPNEVALGFQNSTLNSDPKGVLGGAQIGYNWQAGSLVTGLEADIQGSAIHGSATGPLTFSDDGTLSPFGSRASDEKLSWFGTVRGRLGITVTPELMLYGTGGLAYGRIQTSATTNVGFGAEFISNVSQLKAGWTAGGGAEWAFARNWSAKVEYLFVDLGTVSASGPSNVVGNTNLIASTWRLHDNIVRVGVNYHFN